MHIEIVNRLQELGGEDYFSSKHPILKDESGFPLNTYRIKGAKEYLLFSELPENQRRAMLALNIEQRDESRRRQNEDTKFHLVYNTKTYKPAKLENDKYYMDWLSNNDPMSVYVDCAWDVIAIDGFRMSSGYTSYGIQQIDSWFCREIRSFLDGSSEFSKKQLRKMILCCANLHNVIKWNLIKNLISI